MRRLGALVLGVLLLLLVGFGCTSEDKRQWHEALRELRGDNIKFGSHDHSSP